MDSVTSHFGKVNLWPDFQHICHHFWLGLILHPANPPKSHDKYVEKSVQLVRGSSFRNDLLQNPYFRNSDKAKVLSLEVLLMETLKLRFFSPLMKIFTKPLSVFSVKLVASPWLMHRITSFDNFSSFLAFSFKACLILKTSLIQTLNPFKSLVV